MGGILYSSLFPYAQFIYIGLSVAKWCGHKEKVYSLTWLNHFPEYGNALLSCGPNGEMVFCILEVLALTNITLITHQVVWKVCKSGPTIAVDPLVRMSLPPSKHRWVTTAILLSSPLESSSSSAAVTAASTVATAGEDSSLSHHWVVCGDRKGSLHVYQTNLSTKTNEVCSSITIVLFKTSFLCTISHSMYSPFSHYVTSMVPME